MPTQNRRVATYLPESLDRSLSSFKQERGLKGDSAALIAVLESFFGVTQKEAYSSSSESIALTQRLEAIEKRVDQIKDEILGELRGSPQLSSLPEASEDSVIDESFPGDLLGEAEGALESELSTENLPHLEEVAGESQSELSLENLSPSGEAVIRLKASHLMKRLGVVSSVMSRRKNDPPEKFAEWSISKDPDQVSWVFIPDLNLFQPIGNIPDEVQSKLQSSLPSELPGTLATGDLAQRLKIDSSTLSHWKSAGSKGKSLDDFLKATREKDPEGIGWIPVPGTSRFKPEQDPQSNSKSMLQGELLGVEEV
jgi:hypothetical protein